MLTYNLEERGNLPLYEFLYRSIKKDILNGKLKAGEKLPSKRNFARYLNVSVVTVQNAYEQLTAEGYLRSREKSGYFVAKIELLKPSSQKKPPIPVKKNPPSYFMDLQTNGVRPENFPFSVWSRLMREVLSESQTDLLRPVPYNGALVLREAIADYLYHFRAMSVDPEQILIGAGTEFLYNLLIQLLGQDKIIAIENPGYGKIPQIYAANNVQCRLISLDNEGVSMEELNASDAGVLHITPSHHYPTGIVTPIGRRQEILRWAGQQEGRFIIEDDYDSEFRFAGRPIQPLQSIDENGKVIYINTFSKTIAPSIRISYLVLPEKLLRLYQEKLGFYSCTVPSFEQYTLARFIGEGYFEHHLNRMKSFYRTQRDQVIKAVRQSPFWEKVKILEENAGLHFLLKVDSNLSDEEIVRRAAGEGIRLSCLSQYLYSPKPELDHHIVINYSGIDCQKLPEAIRRLSRAFLQE